MTEIEEKVYLKLVEMMEWPCETRSEFCENWAKQIVESLSLPSVVGSSPTETGHCVWKLAWYDGQYYSTGCNEVFSFEYDDYVKDSGFKFCPFCGKAIKEINEVIG